MSAASVAPAPRASPESPTSSVTARIGAIARRDLTIELSYRLQLVLRLNQVVFFAATLFFISKLVEAPDALRRFGGDYFEFALIGLIITTFATVGLGAFARSIADEQRAGTLEVLLTVPTSPTTLLAGSLVVPLGLACLNVAAFLVLGTLVGVRFPVQGLVLAAPILALTVATFCELGILSAAFIVLTKRGDPLTLLLGQVTTFLAGALFPVALLPAPLQALARAVPAYYGLEGLRQVLLEGAGAGAVAGELIVLLAFNALLAPLGLFCFSRALRVARVTGTLGNY